MAQVAAVEDTRHPVRIEDEQSVTRRVRGQGKRLDAQRMTARLRGQRGLGRGKRSPAPPVEQRYLRYLVVGEGAVGDASDENVARRRVADCHPDEVYPSAERARCRYTRGGVDDPHQADLRIERQEPPARRGGDDPGGTQLGGPCEPSRTCIDSQELVRRSRGSGAAGYGAVPARTDRRHGVEQAAGIGR